MRTGAIGLAAVCAAAAWLVVAGPAAAQEACVVPPALKGFASPVAMPVAAKGRLRLPIGRAVRVMLARDEKLPVAPGKPAAAGTYAGAFGFTVAKAGRYRIATDQAAWIDVASTARLLASAAHGHAPACSGARKMVDYDLRPGFHVLQLSGATGPASIVLVTGA